MSPFTSNFNIKNNTNTMLLHSAIDEVSASEANTDLVARGNATDNDDELENVNDNNNYNDNGCGHVSLMMKRCRRSFALRAGTLLSYQNMLVMLTVLVCGLATVNGLKCQMCGQYNEGVGSITPCLNYSDQYAHLYLKECPKKSEKYCVKYVSELSTVRDCATECVEKEIWETQTYCCNTDGCNGSNNLQISNPLLLLPLIYCIYKSLIVALNERH